MITKIITILAIGTTGIVAGIFFGFVVAINPAFKHLTDTQYVSAMQWINKVIENALFYFVFFGPIILTPIAAYLNKNKTTSILLFVSFAIYLIAVFGITAVKNVPMNNTLAAFDIVSSTATELSKVRNEYAANWNYWHLVRTVASLLAFVLSIVAFMPSEQNKRTTIKNNNYQTEVTSE